jgi:hypothetical protein
MAIDLSTEENRRLLYNELMASSFGMTDDTILKKYGTNIEASTLEEVFTQAYKDGVLNTPTRYEDIQTLLAILSGGLRAVTEGAKPDINPRQGGISMDTGKLFPIGACMDSTRTFLIQPRNHVDRSGGGSYEDGGLVPASLTGTIGSYDPVHCFVLSKKDGTCDIGIDTERDASNLLAVAPGFEYYRRLFTTAYSQFTGGSRHFLQNGVSGSGIYVINQASADEYSTYYSSTNVTKFSRTIRGDVKGVSMYLPPEISATDVYSYIAMPAYMYFTNNLAAYVYNDMSSEYFGHINFTNSNSFITQYGGAGWNTVGYLPLVPHAANSSGTPMKTYGLANPMTKVLVKGKVLSRGDDSFIHEIRMYTYGNKTSIQVEAYPSVGFNVEDLYLD